MPSKTVYHTQGVLCLGSLLSYKMSLNKGADSPEDVPKTGKGAKAPFLCW